MPTRLLKITHDANIAIVSLNRPEAHNSLSVELLHALETSFARLKEDESVVGILLTGEGKSFCAGADIAAMKDMTPLQAVEFSEAGQRVTFAIETVGKPVIAAVNGYALGGGLELALACDFIVAADAAVFASPEVLLGIIPGFGCTQRLPRLIGKSKAKEMIFTGNRVKSDEAFAIGLVNRVVPAVDLISEASALLKQICAKGPFCLKLAKEVIDAGYDVDLKNACLIERDAFALCFTTEDQKEGMGAFLEKRPPQFKGR